jgi:breast cancer 2 susceptibility protein
MQNRYCLELDANRLAIIEKTYHQIQLEIEAEDKIRSQQFRNKGKSLPNKVSDIIDAAELCDLLEFGYDPATIEAELTDSQKKLVEEYQASVQAIRDADISDRVKVKLKEVHELERQVCPLLKVRICDATAPGKSMILSIWRPSEEVIGMMREGNIVRMSSVSANTSRYNEIQISAGKMSRFEVINTQLDRFPLNLAAKRQLTPIEVIPVGNFAPYYNEFDVVGVVVKVGEISKFQLVYIADVELNLLSINFWAGLKKFAYDDIVKVKTVLCASNVQWRPSDANKNGIPKAYASEYTTFKRRPAQQEIQDAVAAMQTALATMNIEEFVEKCVGKISELESKPPAHLTTGTYQTPVRIPAMNSSSTVNFRTPTPFFSHNLNQRPAACATPREFSPGVGVPSSNVHERLKKLLESPSPPPLPFINLNKSNYRQGLKAPPRKQNPSNPNAINS